MQNTSSCMVQLGAAARNIGQKRCAFTHHSLCSVRARVRHVPESVRAGRRCSLLARIQSLVYATWARGCAETARENMASSEERVPTCTGCIYISGGARPAGRIRSMRTAQPQGVSLTSLKLTRGNSLDNQVPPAGTASARARPIKKKGCSASTAPGQPTRRTSCSLCGHLSPGAWIDEINKTSPSASEHGPGGARDADSTGTWIP